MEKFYSKVNTIGVGIKPLERTGRVIETKTNLFGIYKNEYNDYDIIDLNTGLSVNYLHYYRLKDIKANIDKYDEKLNAFKQSSPETYKRACDEWIDLLNKNKKS